MSEPTTELPGMEVAIVGMACRLPGGADVPAFWRTLRDGVDAISRFGDGADDDGYVAAAGVVDDLEWFDASVFGLTRRAAEVLDPQQRLFLECVWTAFEDAGHDPRRFDGAIGVFGGQAMSGYLPLVHANQELVRLVGEHTVRISNDKDHLTTRVAYLLDLHGPAVTVQTTCSTSLVAVCTACQSLLNGECDLAVAGGVSLRIPHRVGYFRQEGFSSPDGRCRAFDAAADGCVPSGGAGVVVLKPLAAALEEGDPVRAVVKGFAVNNDGASKVGYTAPSVDGQATVIEEALGFAQLDPESISYVEAHGTGTPLGDPIEVAALTRAYGAKTRRTGFCALGSVKTNIGHADAASGIAGLVKTVLALEHEQIPPSLNFSRPNPEIDFASSPFYVNTKLAPWPREGVPRRAAVSSFGIGGTNAHVILEEAPVRELASESPHPEAPPRLVVSSAASPAALDERVSQLAELLEGESGVPLGDVAHTSRVGRHAFAHRAAAVGADAAALVDALRGGADAGLVRGAAKASPAPVTFMFPGGSSQYENMARELYKNEPVFREELDEAAESLGEATGADVRSFLYPASAAGELERPTRALPALFATELALARLWMSWGVRPRDLIGHSLGEYVAACLAGVMSTKDAACLVALRSRLFEQLPPGRMLAVSLPEDELVPLLDDRLGVAAVNGPAATVVSGPLDAVDELERALEQRGVEARRLKIGVAAHSPLVDAVVEEFRSFVRTIDLAPPKIPIVSNLTGDWIQAEDATDPEYWARQLRMTVRFADGVGLLLQSGDRVLLEVGPGRALAALAGRHPSRRPEHIFLPSLPHPSESTSALAFAYTTLARLWVGGADVDWSRFQAHETRRRVRLPTYPFQREYFWVTQGGGEEGAAPLQVAPAAAETDGDVDLHDVLLAQIEVMNRQLDSLDALRGGSA